MDEGDDSYRAVVPDGTHLAWSRDTAGAKRALLFENDTNKLIGPPELVKVDEEYEFDDFDDEPQPRPMTPEEIEAALEGLIVVASVLFKVVEITVTAINTKAVPRIKAWWLETIQPRLKKVRDRRAHQGLSVNDDTTSQTAVYEIVDPSKTTPEVFSKEMEAAFEKYKMSMSAAEARERHFAILAAEAFIAEQKRKLSEASIEKYDYFLELNSTMEQLAAQQLPDSINLMLDTGKSLRASGASIEMSKKPDDARIIDKTDTTMDAEVIYEEALLTRDGMQFPSMTIDLDVSDDEPTASK